VEYRRSIFSGDDCPEGIDWRVVNWAAGKGKTLPEYAVPLVIMREMKWTWWEYRAQPQYVIDQLLMFLSSEAQGQKETK